MGRFDEFALCVQGWFDGERHHAYPASFVVRSGRIAEVRDGDHFNDWVRRGVPAMSGGFLMPGLVDAHVHLFLDGAPTDGATRSAHLKQPLEALTEAARRSARQALDCGVTLVRDAGDRHGINNRIRDEARNTAAGDRHGINNRIRDEARNTADLARVRSGGLGVKRPKRYGAFMAADVADEAAIRDSVARLAGENDEIKLILTGIIDFDAGAVTDQPQFDLDATRLVVETAKAHGRRTFAHCSGEKGLAIAARAGIGSIEHGFFMNRETLAVMRDNQVAWTPTFCPVHFQWARPDAVGWSPATVGNLRRILDQHTEHLRLADEMGVTLLMGTDAGSMGVEHGYALFEEIARYLEAGLSLEKTLRAATSTARRHFGIEQSRLEVGAPFDAVLLDDSPFDDIQALRKPRKVWPQA
ncbi:MAG: amidohydrolase family protein [Candidatus Thiodiazotropha sp.]